MAEQKYRCGIVGVVGPANAGKSTLLNTILGTKVSMVSRKAQSTRNRIMGVKTAADHQLIFVDTPGFVDRDSGSELNRQLRKTTEHVVSDVDQLLLVLDADALSRLRSEKRPETISRLIKRFRHYNIDVCLNKTDGMAPDRLVPLIAEVHAILSEIVDGRGEVFPISALRNDNVDSVLNALARKMPVGPALFPEDMVSDQHDSFFISEIIREKVFRYLHKEIPYSAAVEVEGLEREGKLLRLHASIIVERDSQKPMVIGKQGSMLKRIGTDARKELERLFGATVYLELHVRVDKNWTQSHSGLRKHGCAAERAL